MADLNHQSWPEQQHQIEKPAIIKTAESLWVWPQIWRAIFDTKKWVATILVRWETKKEASELNDNFKKEFIEKLKKLPDYKGSKVQEAIEKWTIEIRKIPNRNWYAIYESKTLNLVYITWLDWSRYENVSHFREIDLLWDAIKWWFIKQWYKWIELDIKTWLRRLHKKDWKEVPIFSDEYATATLNSFNIMREFVDDINEEYERRQKQKKR